MAREFASAPRLEPQIQIGGSVTDCIGTRSGLANGVACACPASAKIKRGLVLTSNSCRRPDAYRVARAALRHIPNSAICICARTRQDAAPGRWNIWGGPAPLLPLLNVNPSHLSIVRLRRKIFFETFQAQATSDLRHGAIFTPPFDGKSLCHFYNFQRWCAAAPVRTWRSRRRQWWQR